MILASDRKVEGDRSVARLAKLAKDGQLHAVRILWLVGSDTVRAVPYDAALPASGQMGLERPTLDVRKYGAGRVDAEFKSKMIGQDWHFHANVKATVATGGALELEPEAKEFGAAAPGGDKKLALGKLGYAYDEGAFGGAITDANLDAVRLFLEIGMSPNARAKGNGHPMISAAMGCGDQAEGKPRSEILEALAAAGGDVKAKDENGSTALLWPSRAAARPRASMRSSRRAPTRTPARMAARPRSCSRSSTSARSSWRSLRRWARRSRRVSLVSDGEVSWPPGRPGTAPWPRRRRRARARTG